MWGCVRVNYILQTKHVIWMMSSACLRFATFNFRILGKHLKKNYRIIQKVTKSCIIVLKTNKIIKL